ncbi:NAD-dependent epimerase/dehydratase family protein [Rhizobium sp. L1K21]|uniref:NAD-dependent epimerase/dehydratase family protein n=1 Tax=Rhizobium sp. L1K21 TaxID=2954933 RepID=UPI002093A05D|nr:NAD(P)H-binding protein [Rhizobium sp. L1K21]MCO6188110.1 NAD-dependent epimerase/dehydratase family protein [Rhizobium sp. L1K21]
MKVAVLGANGRLSYEVAKAFLVAGHSVIAVTRNGKCEGLSGDVEFRAADVMKAQDVVAATQGADVVFNGINPPYDKWDAVCMPMAQNVIEAVRANKAAHLFIGNVYNYGKEIPVNANEETPHRLTTEKAVIRENMENLFRRYADDFGVKTVIVRAGDFYGGDKPGTWLDLMIAKDLRKGRFAWPGKMSIPHAFAYLPDLAKVFVSVGERSEELPVFSAFCFQGHTLSGEDFGRALDAITCTPLKRGGVPWGMFRLIGLFYPLLREVVKMNYLWFTPHSLDGSKLEAFLGGIKVTPPQEAIRQALYDLNLWDRVQARSRLAA